MISYIKMVIILIITLLYFLVNTSSTTLLYFVVYTVAAAATSKSLQSCPTLCHPIDGSPPGSAVPGILQARTLEWIAISFSNAWKWKVKVKSFSRVRLLATPWTAAYQAPPSMGFSRQEYWSGVPLPSPIDPTLPSKRRNHWSLYQVLLNCLFLCFCFYFMCFAGFIFWCIYIYNYIFLID